MSDQAWSLESELCQMAGVNSAARACVVLGLLREGQALSSLNPDPQWNWKPSGAESYSFVFDIVSGAERNRYILKAYTPFPSGVSLTDLFDRLLAKRRLIEEAGGRTPHLYAAYKCTVLETYIRYTLREALSQLDAPACERIRTDVLRIASALDWHRFKPISWLDDILADESGAFLVDFGADLGEPGTATGDGGCRQEADLYFIRLRNFH